MTKYEVLLSGKTLKGYELEAVITDVSDTFRIQTNAVKEFLDGTVKVIKKDMTKQDAEELKRKLILVGAQAAIREMKLKPFSELTLVQEKGTEAPKSPIDKANLSTNTDNKRMICPKCKVEQDKAISCSSCGIIIEKYIAIQKERVESNSSEIEGSSKQSPTKNIKINNRNKDSKIPALAIGAGVLGAIVWATIVYTVGYEFSLLAWAIGGAVGVGYTLTHPNGGNVSGSIAAIIAVLAILSGKYIAIQMFFDDAYGGGSGWVEEFRAELIKDDELAISYLADIVGLEYEARGEFVDWLGPDLGYLEEDYPANVWNDAEERWSEFLPTEKHEFRETIVDSTRANIEEAEGGIAAYTLKDSFDLYDTLFLLFGMATAYRIAERGKE